MLKEKIEEILKGKVDINDIDRDADLIWALSDLYNVEKHLNMVLNNLITNKDKDSEILIPFIMELLDKVRKERAKHLKKIQKLKKYSVWCIYKHLLGAMMQFGEVAAKEISMGNLDRARECFETSEFCFETIMLLNKVAEKINKGGENIGVQNKHVEESVQMQEGGEGRSDVHNMQSCGEER